MANTFTSAPTPDCIEVSVFGAGVGESVLVHYGSGNWLVVDSCRDPETRRPVALQYLESLGVPPTAIRVCICTHFHSDHTDGMAELFSNATESSLVVPGALLSPEVKILANEYGEGSPISSELPGSLREFQLVLREAEARQRRKPDSVRYAHPDRLLDKSDDGVCVFTLSPSDTAMSSALLRIAGFAMRPKRYRRLPMLRGPNDVAVAIWITDGGRHVLLGSDLEYHPNRSMGWGAAQSCTCLSGELASVFKIAHHGSAGADDPVVWERMVKRGEVVSLLTTFSPSSLPHKEDIHRIKENSSAAFCTTVPKHRLNREKAVERTLKDAGVTVRTIARRLGQVRMRWQKAGSPEVELYGSSLQL